MATPVLPHIDPSRCYAICYLDLLGYAELSASLFYNPQLSKRVEETFRDQLISADSYTTLLGSFSKLSATTKRVLQQITFRLISDSVIISMPLRDLFEPNGKLNDADEVVIIIGAFLSSVASFCLSMTTKMGYFFRGAVSIGHHYESCPTPNKPQNIFVISPTLVEVVNLEKDVADVSRIIIARSMLTFIKGAYIKTPNPLQEDGWIFRDFGLDGEACLNAYNLPIRAILTESQAAGAAKQLLRTMKDVLAAQLTKNKGFPQRLKKYLWFANYHDQQVDKLGDATLRINPPTLLS